MKINNNEDHDEYWRGDSLVYINDGNKPIAKGMKGQAP